jgi:CheY-like chemotaxis protein
MAPSNPANHSTEEAPVAVPDVHLLIVEDSPTDARLMQLWLGQSRLRLSLSVVNSGRKALHYLRREAEFSDARRADLVVLDSNLPDMPGMDVLSEIRRDPALSSARVLMLTGSYDAQDARQAGELGAVDYRIKPFDAEEFAELLRRVEQFAASIRGPAGPAGST